MGKILLTGGSGRLGRMLVRLRPGLDTPPHEEFDITDPISVYKYLFLYQPDMVIHAAAYTDTYLPDRDPRELERCWTTNAEGTRILATECAAFDIPLVYISTDYVFNGERGGYAPGDPTSPIGMYGASKLYGEHMVRKYMQDRDWLVVRTSFKPMRWPYPQAPDDCFTSADYVNVICWKLIDLLARKQHNREIVHLGTGRKSLYDLARERTPLVRRCKRDDLPEPRPPRDVSFAE